MVGMVGPGAIGGVGVLGGEEGFTGFTGALDGGVLPVAFRDPELPPPPLALVREPVFALFIKSIELRILSARLPVTATAVVLVLVAG